MLCVALCLLFVAVSLSCVPCCVLVVVLRLSLCVAGCGLLLCVVVVCCKFVVCWLLLFDV